MEANAEIIVMTCCVLCKIYLTLSLFKCLWAYRLWKFVCPGNRISDEEGIRIRRGRPEARAHEEEGTEDYILVVDERSSGHSRLFGEADPTCLVVCIGAASPSAKSRFCVGEVNFYCPISG